MFSYRMPSDVTVNATLTITIDKYIIERQIERFYWSSSVPNGHTRHPATMSWAFNSCLIFWASWPQCTSRLQWADAWRNTDSPRGSVYLLCSDRSFHLHMSSKRGGSTAEKRVLVNQTVPSQSSWLFLVGTIIVHKYHHFLTTTLTYIQWFWDIPGFANAIPRSTGSLEPPLHGQMKARTSASQRLVIPSLWLHLP